MNKSYRVILLLCFLFGVVDSGFNAHISNLHVCVGNNYTLSGEASFVNITGGQSITLALYIREDLGNEDQFACIIKRVMPKRTKTLLVIPGKGVCNALHQYMGDAMIDAERVFGFEHPGKCPLKKGTFYLNNYDVRYDEIVLLGLIPKGKYLMDCKMHDPHTKALKGCVKMQLDRLP